MHMTRVAMHILMLGVLMVSFGCKERTSPVPIPAANNQEATLPRIAALSPAVAQILTDLGQKEAIVARHVYDQWSDQSLPACGEQGRIDYELLLSVRPTHVILQDTTIPARLLSLAKDQHWQVTNMAILSLDDIRGAVGRLAELFPQNAEAERGRAHIEAEMDRAWKPRDGFDPKVVGRVLLLAAVDPPSALGPGSFHAQILERLGGISATPSGAPYIVMDAEEVLKLAPDAIVFIMPDAQSPRHGPSRRPDTETPAKLLGNLAKLDLPAVRNKRLVLIDNPAAHLPGTSMIGLADELAEILRAWTTDEP
ncbi:MAG: ABC transporter substrate-binding protein [Pyrinomonadaceae bacterium]|nr:ABC transporter substrate-binding protein [Phycisphaerales bacterium]